nr:hypothetical protein Iba_chr03aCG13610 [Ipomoea batatas]
MLTVLLLCSAPTAKPKAIRSNTKTVIINSLEAIVEASVPPCTKSVTDLDLFLTETHTSTIASHFRYTKAKRIEGRGIFKCRLYRLIFSKHRDASIWYLIIVLVDHSAAEIITVSSFVELLTEGFAFCMPFFFSTAAGFCNEGAAFVIFFLLGLVFESADGGMGVLRAAERRSIVELLITGFCNFSVACVEA